MQTVGELLSQKRKSKGISLEKSSKDLSIKKEQLTALEAGFWNKLPESAFVSGFIKNYADYLGLDSKHALALYRREFDPSKSENNKFKILKPKRLIVTPQILINLFFLAIITVFVGYLSLQYTSILKSPRLKIFTPPEDQTTSVPAIVISGQTEKETTVSVNGEFAPIDADGKFTYQLQLNDGQNIIEIIAAKRLSPKTKITRIVRLSR